MIGATLDVFPAVANLSRMTGLWNFASTWQFDLPLVVGLTLVTVAYVWAVRAVDRHDPAHRWPVRHLVFFLAGIAVTVLATLGPVGAFDDDYFWAHMVQHILLMMLAAPFLLLGEPVLLLLRVSSRDVRRRVVMPVLRSRPVRFLTHPVVSWLVFAGVLFGTHFTGFYEFALEHPDVHNYVEHPLYLGAGLLYYFPLLSGSPGTKPLQPFAKIISLLTMMVPEAMVGFALYSAGSVLYPFYATVTNRPWGPSTALLDQRLGGAFMWSSGMVFHALWISVAAWEWIKSEERKARRIDAEIAAEATEAAGG